MISRRPLRFGSFCSVARLLGWGLSPVLALAAVAQAGVSPVPTYVLTDLGTLHGSSMSQASALNDRGEVVGRSGTSAFLYSGGKMIDLGAPNSSTDPQDSSSATGISNSGQVIGVSSFLSRSDAFLYSNGTLHALGVGLVPSGINASGQIVGTSDLGVPDTFHAVLISGGTTQNLGTLGGAFSGASAVNAAGQVVGQSDLPPNSPVLHHPFLYSGGVMIDLSTLGGSGGATAINDNGEIVGSFNINPQDPNNGPTHAFLYSGGTMHDLGTLGGGSFAAGINDSGVIVGLSYLSKASTSFRAFVDVNGTMYDLNPLISNGSGYLVQEATAINASGQIAADAITPDGEEHAVLLTPTALPLPAAAWAVLPVAPLLWLGMRRRIAGARG